VSTFNIDTHPALLQAAARAARFASGDPERAAEIEEEIAGDLDDRYRWQLARGAVPDIAAQRALDGFGDPSRIRLLLYRRRLATDFRAALQLTAPWKVAAVADAVALAIFVATMMPATWLTPVGRAAFVGILAGMSLLAVWGALAIIRFGAHEVQLAVRGTSPRVAAIPGAALVMLAIAAWLAFVPSASSAVIRNALYPRMELDAELYSTVWVSAVIAIAGFAVVWISGRHAIPGSAVRETS
jgi:hypothetical protein